MTQLVVDRPTDAAPAVRPWRRIRDAQGSGREAAPRLRPARPMPTQAGSTRTLSHPGGSGARACVMPPAPAMVRQCSEQSSWRLTDRGVAVVIVTGLMIMVAALTVVGLTAMRVTSDGYQATASQTLPR